MALHRVQPQVTLFAFSYCILFLGNFIHFYSFKYQSISNSKMYISYLNLFSWLSRLISYIFREIAQIYQANCVWNCTSILPFFKSSLLECPVSVTSIQFLLPDTWVILDSLYSFYSFTSPSLPNSDLSLSPVSSTSNKSFFTFLYHCCRHIRPFAWSNTAAC